MNIEAMKRCIMEWKTGTQKMSMGAVRALKKDGEKTPSYIIAHAMRQWSRGRGPSESYRDKTDPIEALALALKEFILGFYKIAVRKWQDRLHKGTSGHRKKLARYIFEASRRGNFSAVIRRTPLRSLASASA